MPMLTVRHAMLCCVMLCCAAMCCAMNVHAVLHCAADMEEHMKWVYEKALARAQEFGIQVRRRRCSIRCIYVPSMGGEAAGLVAE